MHKINFALSLMMVTMAVTVSAYPQILVTPVVKPTPPGSIITISSGTGFDSTNPHISGDLVSYTNVDVSSAYSHIHYFNFANGVDSTIANGGGIDFLSDIDGGRIAFSHSTPGNEGNVELFDTATHTLTGIDTLPSGAARDYITIGGPNIAWSDRTADPTFAQIVVWNMVSGTATQITSDTVLTNLEPDLSPDGTVLTWSKCTSSSGSCDVYDAVWASGIWTTHQLTTGYTCENFSVTTNGSIVVYTRPTTTVGNPGGHIYWQPVAGGVESELSMAGEQVVPAISGNLISFMWFQTGTVNTTYPYVYDLSTNFLYPLTNTPGYRTLNDVSTNASGVANVVWEQSNGRENIFGFSFTPLSALPPADLAVYKVASPIAESGKNLIYAIAVVNRGPNDAQVVTLTDTLPSGTSFVSALSTQGTCANNAGTVTCNLGALKPFSLRNPNGAVIFLTTHVTAGAGSSITNTARVTASNPDPNTANNAASASTTVVAASH